MSTRRHAKRPGWATWPAKRDPRRSARSPTSCSTRTSIPRRARCSTSAATSCRPRRGSSASSSCCRDAAVPRLRRARRRRAATRDAMLASSCAARSTSCARALHRQVYRATPPQAAAAARHATTSSAPSAPRKADGDHRALPRARCPSCARRSGSTCAPRSRAIPAATGIDEILFCYPGTYAITVYRIAHALLREGAVIDPAHDDRARAPPDRHRHPPRRRRSATSFFIDHGTGVVIGETTLIGDARARSTRASRWAR